MQIATFAINQYIYKNDESARFKINSIFISSCRRRVDSNLLEVMLRVNILWYGIEFTLQFLKTEQINKQKSRFIYHQPNRLWCDEDNNDDELL